jgi:predicted DNA-binding transcriptional regulator AlpA
MEKKMINELVPEKDVIKSLCGGKLPSESTIWLLRKKGDLPPSIKIGRRRYTSQEVVDAWLQSRLGQ